MKNVTEPSQFQLFSDPIGEEAAFQKDRCSFKAVIVPIWKQETVSLRCDHQESSQSGQITGETT